MNGEFFTPQGYYSAIVRGACTSCGGNLLAEEQSDGSREVACLLCGRVNARLLSDAAQRDVQETERVRNLPPLDRERYWRGNRRRGRPLKIRESDEGHLMVHSR